MIDGRRKPDAGGRDGLRRGVCAATPFTLAVVVACGSAADVEPPVPLGEGASVVYPPELWDRGTEGETLVRVLVNEDGEVDSVEVASSSGREAFDRAAVEGARGARFEPARRSGEAVAAWARIPVRFAMDRSRESPAPDRSELEAGDASDRAADSGSSR